VADHPQEGSSGPQEQPLELILARNLVSIVSMPAFLVDVEDRIVFDNEAIAEIMGRRFEETGALPRERWRDEVGPVDEYGRPVPREQLPVALAMRDGRPVYGRRGGAVGAGSRAPRDRARLIEALSSRHRRRPSPCPGGAFVLRWRTKARARVDLTHPGLPEPRAQVTWPSYW
jgi:PAS domain-containing protein